MRMGAHPYPLQFVTLEWAHISLPGNMSGVSVIDFTGDRHGNPRSINVPPAKRQIVTGVGQRISVFTSERCSLNLVYFHTKVKTKTKKTLEITKHETSNFIPRFCSCLQEKL